MEKIHILGKCSGTLDERCFLTLFSHVLNIPMKSRQVKCFWFNNCSALERHKMSLSFVNKNMNKKSNVCSHPDKKQLGGGFKIQFIKVHLHVGGEQLNKKVTEQTTGQCDSSQMSRDDNDTTTTTQTTKLRKLQEDSAVSCRATFTLSSTWCSKFTQRCPINVIY